MLTSKEIVNNYVLNFIEEWDGRSNKFYNKVKKDPQFYEKIVDLYFETKSANKVSDIVKLDSKYITTILNKFGVSTSKRKMTEDVLELIILDKLSGMSLGQLKVKYNFSLETLKRQLNNRGVDTSVVDPIDKLDESVIEDYKTKQIKQIAKERNVGKETIKKYLIKNNVPIRTLSQSASLNIKNNGVNFRGENILFYSSKNKVDILANSSYELARFLELEEDKSVVSYTKNVETICYNDCNNNYTADILIFYKNGEVVVEEVKPNWFIKYMNKVVEMLKNKTINEIATDINISEKSVKKFILSYQKFKEADLFFGNKGIKFIIITEDNINIKLAEKFLNRKI